jgi:hypothetical protein
MEVVNLSKNNTGKNACATRNLLTSCSFVVQAFLPVLFLKLLFHSFLSRHCLDCESNWRSLQDVLDLHANGSSAT